MKKKFSFFEIIILVWTIVLPTILSTLVIINYIKYSNSLVFEGNILMKIEYVVSVLFIATLLEFLIHSIIEDIKRKKKQKFYRKHPEEREKDKQKAVDEFNKLFEELDKKIEEEKEKGK